MSRFYDHFPPYVPVAERRAKAEKMAKKLAAKGKKLLPVTVSGRLIAKSFWGKAWCKNLESYSDYANRLPRGRTYARNGSVIDLQISSGQIEAMVSGSSVYTVKIGICPVAKKSWTALKQECAGQIGSLLELLGGKLSTEIMTTMTRRETGLFPKPAEIKLSCSCPDGARMCKHVAAVLYGVGARLDECPELLFLLRGANHEELIAEADVTQAIEAPGGSSVPAFDNDDLSSIFGIDLEEDATTPLDEAPASNGATRKPRTTRNRKTPAEPKSKANSKRPARPLPASRSKKESAPAAKRAPAGAESKAPRRRKRASPTPAQIRAIHAAAASGQSALSISREMRIGYSTVLEIAKSRSKTQK